LNIGPHTSGCDRDNELPPFVPDDNTLPYFAYGLFKPGEPLSRFIRDLVDGTPSPATTSGSLPVRDGLPLLDGLAWGCQRQGDLFRARPG